jgi:Rho GTPase-activating protein RGD1
MEKSKNRVEITAEELERVLIQKEGESLRDTGMQGRSPGGGHRTRVIGKAVAKGGLLLKGKNPGNVSLILASPNSSLIAEQIQRQEDDVRARMSAASDLYRKNMTDTQAIRQEYFNFQLPRILRVYTLHSCDRPMVLMF